MVEEADQPVTARHRHLAGARAHMMLGQVSEALTALDALGGEAGPAELAQVGPDGDNLRAATLVTLGEFAAADEINLKALENARSAHTRPVLEASLIGLGESRLAAGSWRSATGFLGDAVRARAGPYPFRWQQRGRTRLLQARLDLAAGRIERALVEARELLADSTRSGDAVRAIAAKLLETEALAESGAEIDSKVVGESLKRAADVLGGESWRIALRLAHLTGNKEWSALAERQLAHLLRSSGQHAEAVRESASAFRERVTPRR
jgi:tetratricopeptide (TPR) repeat protein